MSNKKSQSFDAASFFDKNAAVYARGVCANDVTLFDLAFFKFIKKNPVATLLDVGAGSGRFSSLVRLNFPDVQVTALDPSVNLLTMIQDRSIIKVVGKSPDLNLDPGERFSFIHVSNVFHHLVGKTINESRNIVKESLLVLKDHLEDSGYLMIMEELCETYAIPRASRTLAFFLLSLADKLNVTVPWFFSPNNSQSVKGLLVCMYTASD